MAHKHIDSRKVRYFEDRAEFLLRKCRPEDKTDFVLQTFIELSKDGWSVCTNGRVATSVEKMIPLASAEATGCLLKAFTKELEPLFSTKFAHHVLHAAIRHCASYPDLRQDELISSCIADYLDFMWENYASFLHQPHASPALRVYLQLLSGVNIPKSPHTGLYEVDKVTLADPLDVNYLDRITDLANQFLLSKSFNAFVVDPMSGAFLQTLIIVCWKRLEKDFEAICSNILRKSQLLKISDDEEFLKLNEERGICYPMGFSHPVAVFFMETLISLLPGSLLRKFLKNHLLNMPSLKCSTTKMSVVSALAGHENACRVLRATIRAVRRASDLEEIMSALQLPGIGETGAGLRMALDSGQHYLLIALAEACRRCSGSRAEVVQATCEKILLGAFGYSPKMKSNDQLIKSIVRLKRQLEREPIGEGEEEEEEEEKPSVTECKLAGCLLAEEMLGFTHHRPIRLAISLASLPAAEMVAWARNHMLHRVVESALLSPSVPEQRKLQIFACLKPQLGTLAMDQSGSRVVEALWRSSEAFASKSSMSKEMLSLREEIARCLAPLADRLEGAKFGRFVENLVGSAVYRTNPQRWRQVKLAGTSVGAAKTKENTTGGSKSSVKRRQSQPDLQKCKHWAKKQKC